MQFTQTAAPTTGLKEVAILVATPEELERDHGIEFEGGHDDLGTYVWASGEVGREPFAFQRYDHSQERGTVLWGRESADALVEALNLLDKWRP